MPSVWRHHAYSPILCPQALLLSLRNRAAPELQCQGPLWMGLPPGIAMTEGNPKEGGLFFGIGMVPEGLICILYSADLPRLCPSSPSCLLYRVFPHSVIT